MEISNQTAILCKKLILAEIEYTKIMKRHQTRALKKALKELGGVQEDEDIILKLKERLKNEKLD